MVLYLDYNATTPIDKRILENMNRIYNANCGNASAVHYHGWQAQKHLNRAAMQINSLLRLDGSAKIIFTSGATESNNLALFGLARYLSENKHKRHIVSSAIEHQSVLYVLEQLKTEGFEIELVPPEPNGRINSDDFISRIRKDTILASLMHVNNETGVIQPVQAIGKTLQNSETAFHIDAAQSCGKLVNDLRETPYDLLSISAHKMGGPQGIGALILKKPHPLKPMILGGGQQGAVRSGTLPVALIVGLGKACQIAMLEYKSNRTNYQTNKQLILATLKANNIEYAINGDEAHAMPNVLNISIKGIDSEMLMAKTKRLVSFSKGSACNSNVELYSHVLKSMGLSDDRIKSSIRLSWGQHLLDQTALQTFAHKIKELQ